MAFKRVDELNTESIKFLICDYFAVDEQRQLSLSTTNGRTRNARRWFVRKFVLPSGRTDWSKGQVCFRAWTLNEAMEHLNEPRIMAKIDKQFADELGEGRR